MGATLFLVFVSICCAGASLPPYIKVCPRNTPDMAECIKNSVYGLRQKLAEGIPELKVPALEPLPLDEVKLRSGPQGAKIDANITNLLVWGPSSFEILDLKPEVPKNRFIFRIKIPDLHFKGDYDIDMNVLILKYKGQGPLTGNFTNLQADVFLKGHVEKINGQKHIQFQKFTFHFTIEKSHLYLGNLFSQDPKLGTATNDVINDNADVFIDQLRPALESSLADKFTEAANGICRTFTYDELFPLN